MEYPEPGYLAPRPVLKWTAIDPKIPTTTPTYGSQDAIGLDLRTIHGGIIRPGEITILDTNVAVEIPVGYYGRIAPRSGLSLKGLDVLAGVIDPDYRGELKIILVTHGAVTITFSPNDKVAQLILERAEQAEIRYVDAISGTQRGSGGFGSTGTK